VSFGHQITPLILTHDEEANIGRTMARLSWADEVVVVDSGSTDATLAILRGFPNARVVRRPFDSFADQCNHGLDLVRTPWVLSLDADYVLTEALIGEVLALSPAADTAGFEVRFRYCVGGRPIRASLYPPRTVLYRRDRARYANVGHGHRVVVDGLVGALDGEILHDDRKPLERWLEAQARYARQEAQLIHRSAFGELNLPDRIRKLVVAAPMIVFLYTLFVKGAVRDGWPGLGYALQRTLAEMVLSLRLVESHLSGASVDPDTGPSPRPATDPHRTGAGAVAETAEAESR